jgi:hypothetical protein
MSRIILSVLLLVLVVARAWAQTPPSLDGTPVQTQTGGSAGVSVASGVTTTGSSGILVTAIMFNTGNGPIVSVVSSPALTWAQRGTVCGDPTRSVVVYTAPYSSSFSGSVTVTNTGNGFIDQIVFAVKGAAATPFDSAGPVCATTGGGTGPSIALANNHDFVFCNMGFSGFSYALGTGWTAVGGTAWVQGVMQQTTSTGGSFTCTVTAAGIDAGTIDAFTADSAGGGGGGTLMLLGTGQ